MKRRVHARIGRLLLLLLLFGGALGQVGLVRAAWVPKTPPLSTAWTAQVSTTNALPEYPRPQMARPDWQNLNGEWQFANATAGQTPPFGQTLAESVLVPFPIESALSGIMRHQDRMWYRRSFIVPSAWAGRRVQLNFGAVDWEATVYVNGVLVGSHQGGYDSFSFDITDRLNGGTNELIVGIYDPTDSGGQPIGKQRNSPSGIWYTAASGIWQTVWLEPTPAARITRLDITPDIDTQTLKLTVQGAGISGQTVEAIARDAGQQVGSATGNVGAQLSIPVPSPKLWSPDRPFLYDLQVALKSGTTTVDQVTSYFGMRKISLATVGGYLRPVLNNQFLFEIGPLDQGYWPDGIYTAPTDAALRYDIDQTKALGFNMIRKHIKVEPARWYYWADKLGVLVWQDMPAMDNAKAPSASAKTQFELELRELVDEHRSSPAIVMWVVQNEGWGQYDQARLAGLVKGWDSSRLVDNMSGVNCCGSVDGGNGDLIDYHTYVGPDSPVPSASRAAVLGEYGGLGLRVAGHEWSPGNGFGYEMVSDGAALTSRYVGLTQRVQSYIGDTGLSAAVYTEITDVENEVNGMLTYDRAVVKPVAAQIKAAHRALIAASQDLNTGGVWKLDEGSGTTAGDSSGGGSTGTLTNGPTWTSGQIGGALSFNGSNQSVAINRAVVNTSGDYSVAAWVQLTSTANFATAVSQDGANVSGFFLQYSPPDGRFAFSVTNRDATSSTTTRALASAAPTLGAWYHLVGVRDSAAGVVRLYVNGALAGSQPYTDAWSATGPTAIGRAKWNGGAVDFWPGKIDDVRVFNRALSDAEIRSVYGGGLQGYWAMSEGNGTSTADSSGSGYTGALTNGPAWTTGKSGNGLSFDGANDFVDVNGSAVNTSGDYSVAAWVQLTSTANFATAVSQDGANVSGFFLQYSLADGRFAFSVTNRDAGSAGTTRALASAAPTLGAWYHLVGVRDAVNGTIKLYVNGAPASTQPYSAKWSAAGHTVIGRAKWNGAQVDFWPGKIDQARVYSRTLTDAEVLALYNAGN